MVATSRGYSGMWIVNIGDEDDGIVAMDGDGNNSMWVSTNIKEGFTHT